MRITILTVGSRGDIQPYVALGAGLRCAGHRVRLVAHEPFQGLVAEHGLEFVPVAGDPRWSLQDERGQSWLESGANPVTFVRRMLTVGQPFADQLLDDMIDAAPHDWLFPRMAAVVHHGGAGTTAAGLRAGVPAIVVPYFADQPFWGWRVEQLGVGPPPIPRRRLSAARLAAAIETATRDRAMQRRAAALGARIRAEDGVARAVEVINQNICT